MGTINYVSWCCTWRKFNNTICVLFFVLSTLSVLLSSLLFPLSNSFCFIDCVKDITARALIDTAALNDRRPKNLLFNFVHNSLILKLPLFLL